MVERVDGRWNRPSPCTEWDARGVLEHVIGFHDVLLLQPTGAKPKRPRDDPTARWALTESAILSVIGGKDEGGDGGPGDGALNTESVEGPVPNLAHLLPLLTVDVLAHTWDLARAVGLAVELEPQLCRSAYETVRPNADRLRESGMFAPPFPVPDDADPASRLVAFLGRDPEWSSW